jgi:putative DNA primase/helicase
VRYNVITKEEEILIPDGRFSIDNRQNASLAWLISEASKFRLPQDRIPDYVTYLADANQYNPVTEWITSKPWDGRDRLSELLDTVTCTAESERLKRPLITRWMISAVAAAFRPTGVSAHGVLVMQGGQYVGKTLWFKRLVPAELGVLKDGLSLKPDDRDSVMRCVRNWLVELGEVDATFRKADVAALKSFLTSDRDVLRRAYGRRESEFARRTVFFASVNPKNYLHDDTGNRRYWTLEVTHLDLEHTIDMQQCWAQVYEDLYEKGESWFLTKDEFGELTKHNQEYEQIDPVEDLIANKLAWGDPKMSWKWRTATEVLMDCGLSRPSKSDSTRAAMIIRKLNGDESKRTASSRLLLAPDVLMTRA